MRPSPEAVEKLAQACDDYASLLLASGQRERSNSLSVAGNTLRQMQKALDESETRLAMTVLERIASLETRMTAVEREARGQPIPEQPTGGMRGMFG